MVIIEFLLSKSFLVISRDECDCEESVARAFKVSVKNKSVEESLLLITSLLSEHVKEVKLLEVVALDSDSSGKSYKLNWGNKDSDSCVSSEVALKRYIKFKF